MAVRDIVGLAKSGTKTPAAKKQGSGPRRASKVNPDVGAAMAGQGGRCVGCNNPQGVNKSVGNSPSNHRAEKMDRGLPLSPVKE